MSLVVGRGSGSWVWVNVVGKKKFMKRKSPRTYQKSYSPSPR